MEIIYDFLCPWCYRQFLALDQGKKKGWAFSVSPLPFLLQADVPLSGAVMEESVRAKLKTSLHALKDDPLFHDRPLSLPSLIPSTYLAHQGALLLKDDEDFLPYILSVYEGYFRWGKNIGDPEVMDELLEPYGLSTVQLMEKADAGEYRKAVLRAFTLRNRYGLTTVPAMIVGEKVIPHSTSVEELESIVSPQ